MLPSAPSKRIDLAAELGAARVAERAEALALLRDPWGGRRDPGALYDELGNPVTLAPNGYEFDRWGEEAQAGYLEIAQRDTGAAVADAVAEKKTAEDRELLVQSREIGRRLALGYGERAQKALDVARRLAGRANGYAARGNSHAARDARRLARIAAFAWRRFSGQGPMERDTGFDLFTIGIHSGTVTKQPQFRRCMILPYVAKRVRGPKLVAVEEWLQDHIYARMWTITSGERVGLRDLEKRLRAFHKRLGRLATYIRRFGLEMVFRATELGGIETDANGNPVSGAGEIEIDPVTGEPTFHVHAHCLVWSTIGYRSPDRWASVLASVWKYWGNQWDDSGRVRGARELVKYVTKPGEMLRLSPVQLSVLADCLRRKKLAVPLGSLKRRIRERKDRWERLNRRRTGDGPIIETVKDWNRQTPQPKAERDLHEVLASKRTRPDGCEFRIIARSAPAFSPGSVLKEPTVTVLVSGRLDVPAVLRHRLIADIADATREAWERACRVESLLPIRVHTCTSTPTPGDPPGRPRPPDRPGLVPLEAGK